jgi:hypothetical protein
MKRRQESKMRKFLAAAILTGTALVSTSADAYGPGHRHGYHGHHGHWHRSAPAWGWVAPTIIGGVIGYEIARSQTPVIIQQPQVVAPQPGNCLVNIFNPYLNRYENVVVACNQPVQQSVPQIIQ